MIERRADHAGDAHASEGAASVVADALEQASVLYDNYVKIAQIAHNSQPQSSPEPATNIPLGLVIWE